jgi:hypothetical protein
MVLRAAGLAATVLLSSAAQARGVSPYLPLRQSPEIERQIERVMILADRPILTRPLAAATVLDALPEACERDPVLCQEVRRYLASYMQTAGVAHASLAVAAASDEAAVLANRRGMRTDSGFEASGAAYWQVGDYALLNVGLVAYEDETIATGTLLSLGTEHAQLDIGFRDHWLSPMTDSAMLLSTEAQTMPSLTLSNYTPLTRWRVRYEIFAAEMSESSNIAFQGGFTSGNPVLAGLHLSIEPFSGWSLGVSRLMQFGGGERDESAGDLFDALFRPSEYDNTGTDADFGNQVAAITSRFIVPGAVPFAVYFEYAGEDTSTLSNVRLGNSSLSAGVHFPALRGNVDLTAEASEWQNGWYTHHIYRDGLRHEGNVIGHWAGDRRQLNDAVGGRSLMLRAGWQPRFGGVADATYRTVDNESYTVPDYERAHAVALRYSRGWRQYFVGAELDLGRDIFGESYSRLGAFIRF